MPEPVLQNDNGVAALQRSPRQSVDMSLPPDEQCERPPATTRKAASLRGAFGRLSGPVLAAATLVGLCVLVAGCGEGSSHPGVADLGTSTAVPAEPSAAPSGSKANPTTTALAFIACMRSHGEPNMPEPNVSKSGSQVSVNINANSGLDVNSPQFGAATKACKRMLPGGGVASQRHPITLAAQADYLRAAACMRSHGIPDFPDPTFASNNVAFTTRTPIDATSPEYKSTLTTCQKLIPAGLPYSSSNAP
jgi:hypothetical protein